MSRFFLQGLLPIQRGTFLRDCVAGCLLAALAIPEVMGYTKIIGTPLVTGLYTIIFPGLAFALLGSSRHLVVGADSATAAIVAAALSGLAAAGSTEYVALTSAIALLAGFMILAARILDLGFLTDFLSRTVLIGFLSGVGIQVALSQVHAMLGIGAAEGGFLFQTSHLLDQFGHANHTSMAIVGIALVVIVGFEFLAPQIPGALIVVIGLIIASRMLKLEQFGVVMVGDVPQGLPHLTLPILSLSKLSNLFSVSFSCAIIILAQSAATSRAYAYRNNDSFDENNDLVGLGIGNLVSALSGSFVINGSPTKTAIVDTAGGKSQVAQITMAIIALAVLLFFTGPLAYLPVPALAAVVFLIGVKLVDHRGMIDVFKRNRDEFWLAFLTATTVVLAGVMPGIILALVMSLLNHLRVSYKPQTAVLCPSEHGHWLPAPLGGPPATQAVPGLVVYWFGADLFYANVDHFIEEALQLAKEAPLRWLVIDAGSISSMDYSAERAIANLNRELVKRDTALVWTHARGELRKNLAGYKTFESLRDCVAEFKRTDAPSLPPKNGGARRAWDL